jgi:ankyrin repeat protein
MQRLAKGAITIAAIIAFLFFARGPDGLICKHLYPSAYTQSEQALWRGLAGGSCGAPVVSNKEDISSQLRVAAGLGRADAVGKLIEEGANVDAGGPATDQVPAGGSALMLAAANNQEAVVRLLLSKGAHPNQQDEGGGTALIYASWKGHVGIVKMLLESGADASAATRDGRTALTVARSAGHTDVATLLERHSPGK